MRNPIAPIDKWHIFLNLFLPSVPVAKVVICAVALLSSPLLLFAAFVPELIAAAASVRTIALGHKDAARISAAHGFGHRLFARNGRLCIVDVH